MTQMLPFVLLAYAVRNKLDLRGGRGHYGFPD